MLAKQIFLFYAQEGTVSFFLDWKNIYQQGMKGPFFGNLIKSYLSKFLSTFWKHDTYQKNSYGNLGNVMEFSEIEYQYVRNGCYEEKTAFGKFTNIRTQCTYIIYLNKFRVSIQKVWIQKQEISKKQ